MTRAAELEAHLVAHPDDRDAYLVYGDLLQAEGDPRGELVTIQIGLATTPGDPVLLAREAELMKQHGAHWLGELAGLGPRDLAVSWRSGFVDAIRLGPPTDAGVTDQLRTRYGGGELHTPEALRQLAGLPGVMFLRRLVIVSSDDGSTAWPRTLEAIALHGTPPNLVALALRHGGYRELEHSELGDLSPSYPRLGQLRELAIEIGHLELGQIELPELRALAIVTTGLTCGNLASMRTATWPHLERLALCLGETGGTGACDIELAALRPILAGDNLAQLRHLGLASSSIVDDIAVALPTSQLLAQLETLDLSRGTMSDVGGRAIVARADAFRHLTRLDLSHAYLTDSVRAALAALGPHVVLGDPQSPEDDFRIVTL